jgi:phosphatidylserine/phosphatidylglycerophosphate/cardiolipin synthase-like enzyme
VGVLTKEDADTLQTVIDEHFDELRDIPGFIGAEPGFPLVDGEYGTEPAIVVWVNHKTPPDQLLAEDRAPAQLEGRRVCVMQADPVQQLDALRAGDEDLQAAAAAAVYTYKPLDGNPIDKAFKVHTPMLCHVGPDAGWPALRDFLNAAEHELSVSIYDFNALHISTALIARTLAAPLNVIMNWDDSPRVDSEIDTLAEVREKLGAAFRDEIVQTGSGHRFANSYHEKVAVRDSSAFWLSSGNWTVRSQPAIDPVNDPDSGRSMYGKYNREWHVIVDDADLAAVFEKYIRYDFEQSELEAAHGPAAVAAAMPDVFVPLEDVLDAAAMAAEPQPVAPLRLPAAGKTVRVQPVLTPDNYVDRVTTLIDSAKSSVYMQFAYITYSDAAGDEAFTTMLDVVRKKCNDDAIDTKIIVGSAQAAAKVGVLVQKGFNQKAFRQQANIHNKGIVIDGEVVLVSSANWSSDGVLRNRDAGLIIHDPDVAGYYQDVFLDDWQNRATKIKEPSPALLALPGAPTPAGMAKISWEDYVGS